MRARKFRSKKDPWVMLLICAAIVLLAASLVMTAIERPDPATFAGALAATIIPMALLAWMLLATHYTIDRNSLKIVSGPLRWHVPIDEKASVERTRSWWSSPALSLDRLRICYSDGKSVMISPADKETFIKTLGLDTRATGGTRV